MLFWSLLIFSKLVILKHNPEYHQNFKLLQSSCCRSDLALNFSRRHNSPLTRKKLISSVTSARCVEWCKVLRHSRSPFLKKWIQHPIMYSCSIHVHVGYSICIRWGTCTCRLFHIFYIHPLRYSACRIFHIREKSLVQQSMLNGRISYLNVS